MESLENNILPHDHPLTKDLKAVVSEILTASNLGVVNGEARQGLALRLTSDLDADSLHMEEWKAVVVDDEDNPRGRGAS